MINAEKPDQNEPNNNSSLVKDIDKSTCILDP
jgi:hypothetical protein